MKIREATCSFLDVGKEYSRWHSIGIIDICKNLCRKQCSTKFGIENSRNENIYAGISISKNEIGIEIGRNEIIYATPAFQ